MNRVVDAGCPVIVGAGLAGLVAAIELSPKPCVVLSAGAVSTGTSTGWAQGGVAAAVGQDDDPALHAEDTLAAGAGLCHPDVVRRITAAGPETIDWLAELGAQFDRTADGALRLGLEGAHSRRRIVHAHGDRTGAELLETVVAAARRLESVSLWDHSPAVEVLTEGDRVAGVLVSTPDGLIELRTETVLLATGGIGGLFSHTTNPLSSRGQGLALAHRAGADLRDIEMVQFHPTALDVGIDPMPLVSEAVRGEGAILVNELGEWVLRNPLAARDVVSRAEWAQLQAGHRVFLDARTDPGERFSELFGSIYATARSAGLDPAKDLLPVRPAAHYHMGGVQVDLHGRSTVRGLYAAGEVASTGLHGANRLASNSLLEAVVCGRWVAQHWRAVGVPAGEPLTGRTYPIDPVWTPDPVVDDVRRVVSRSAGVLRDADGLTAALEELAPLRHHDAGLVGHLLVSAALRRQESRGGHTRLDFPETSPIAEHVHTLADEPVGANPGGTA
ncbi:MAG TPA: L-aspartate oxidase [Propionicimonas sp.]|nr:L-aspartate oxidase [Propionicimonas sp.]HRA05335.1 L-aspartate oxidase [Propionicimonas sp.]